MLPVHRGNDVWLSYCRDLVLSSGHIKVRKEEKGIVSMVLALLEQIGCLPIPITCKCQIWT